MIRNQNHSRKKRLHFGVLISTIDDTCQHAILDSISKYCKMNDIHLTIYVGTYQTVNYDYAPLYETCFEAIESNKSLDGIILFSGFIDQDVGFGAFFEAYPQICKDIPAISVSCSLPGIPSVISDNTNGIFSAVDHLIKEHGKKEIVFVSGPKGHLEAEERFDGYKKALEANGIKFDERYILPGNFSSEEGRAAVVELIDVRGISFDAIAACDDTTAIGVLNELRSRNVLVPADVAVTGFDDDKGASTSIPSLSTVRQDFFAIGMMSAEMLLRSIKGQPLDDLTIVPTIFLPRQSCGCMGSSFSNMKTELEYDPAEEDSLFAFALRKFKPLFQGDVPYRQIRAWASSLVRKVTENPFNRDDFLCLFDEIIINYNHYSRDFSIWHEAMSVLTLGVELYRNEVNSAHSVLSTLIHATTLIHDVCLKDEKTHETAMSEFRTQLRKTASALVLIFDTDILAGELFEHLPALSIDTTLVGLYSNPVKINEHGADRNINTLIGFSENKKFIIRDDVCKNVLYSDYSMIDDFDFEFERRTLIFLPLFFKDEEMGFLLLPYNDHIHMDVYDTLRTNISAAVRGAELLSKLHALSITDELTGLLNRRGFFQFAKLKLQSLTRSTEFVPLILFMDMDGLKKINDVYGHSEGDTALSVFAQLIREALRKDDIIGRLGGDEFVVFSSIRVGVKGTQPVRRIRSKLDEYNKKKLHPYMISTSIGSVVLNEATNECFEAAMLSADSFLYEEKAEKRKKGISR
ncbi:MAG: GGDEF domain-containing protein [Oscillospiraceae bacterium]|nr:GGDEF domain-containing protein [Oscillospiraceae bacterium]